MMNSEMTKGSNKRVYTPSPSLHHSPAIRNHSLFKWSTQQQQQQQQLDPSPPISIFCCWVRPRRGDTFGLSATAAAVHGTNKVSTKQHEDGGGDAVRRHDESRGSGLKK